MPTYNWLSHSANNLGVGLHPAPSRQFAHALVNQTLGESLTITTGFKPHFIAIIYGKDAKRALLIYNEDISTTSHLFASTEDYLQTRSFGDLEFNISSVSDTGFTLAPTTIATESATVYYFVLDGGAGSSSSGASAYLHNLSTTTTVNLGFVPNFLTIVKADGTSAIYWTADRSTGGFAGASTTDYSAHSTTMAPWNNWTDSGFIINSSGDNAGDYYYFAALEGE